MTNDVLEREWALLKLADPLARAVVEAVDADAAYDAITWSRIDLLEDPELPHTGELFCAWAELEDLHEIGRSRPAQFHEVVRAAAEDWLSRPETQSTTWLIGWIAATRGAVAARFAADGTTLDGSPF